MSGWWAQEAWESSPLLLLSWVFWVIFSIVLHELGHGWAALSQGDDTPRVTGHMTWNPVVHMGWPSLLVFAVVGIAWGLMPVNPARFRDGRLGSAIVSAAGPAMNLGLAALSLTAGVLLRRSGVDSPEVLAFFSLGGWLNVYLLLFNLLPIPPLDGSRILGACSPTLEAVFSQPAVASMGFMLFLLVGLSGGMSFMSALAANLARRFQDGLTQLLG